MTVIGSDDGKMPKFCSRECSLTTVCILQMVATLERLVFDFLGYMWAPILTGFLNVVFILFGIFGAHQYRPKLLVAYAVWSAFWLLWNLLVIFLYLEIGPLSLERHSIILDFGTNSESWWVENGLGCNVTYNISTSKDFRVQQTRVSIEGCVLDYKYVEVIHASVHIILSVMGLALTLLFISKLNEEDDTYIEMSDSSMEPVLLDLPRDINRLYRSLDPRIGLPRITESSESIHELARPRLPKNRPTSNWNDTSLEPVRFAMPADTEMFDSSLDLDTYSLP